MRRRHALVTATLAASVAAIGVAMGPVALAEIVGPLRQRTVTLTDSERGISLYHTPVSRSAAIKADRALRRRCAVLSYRIKNLPYCPAPATAAGKRLLARQIVAYAKRQSPGVQRASAVGPREAVGEWGPPFSLKQLTIDAVMLPTGRVLIFSYIARSDAIVPGPGGRTDVRQHDIGSAYVWDPVTNDSKQVTPPIDPETGVPYNIWCAGHTLLADGRVVVAGGTTAWPNEAHPSLLPPAVDGYRGAKGILTFNPWNETWTLQKNAMRKGRWYPTLTRLANGDVVITSGWDETGNNSPSGVNLDTEVFRPDPNLDGDGGTLTRWGDWTNGGIYPQQFLLPNGNVLAFGPAAQTKVLDTTTRQWSANLSPLSDVRNWGGAVILPPEGPGDPPGRVMALGGSPEIPNAPWPAVRTSETLNLANPATETWTPGPSLNTARSHLNTVLLPDKSVLAIGGGYGRNDAPGGLGLWDGPVFESELLPFRGTAWQRVASQNRRRTYHSVGLLLPDATVFSAGDDNPQVGPNEELPQPGPGDMAEIYSPPYLFKGARPQITSVQGALDPLSPLPLPRLSYATQFEVRGSASATKFVIIAPGSVTHAVDMNQRLLDLATTVENGRTFLTTPSNPNAAPPGYYMLFAVNGAGVPSTARWIRLDPNAPVPPPLPPPPTPSVVSASFSASPARPAVNATVTFSDTSTSTGGPIVSRLWDLDNDGAFDDAIGAIASRRFTSAGTFTVRLQVADATPAQGVATRSITVTTAPTGAPPPSGGATATAGPKPKIRSTTLTVARGKRTTVASFFLVTDRAFSGNLTAQFRAAGKTRLLGSVRRTVRGTAGRRLVVRFTFNSAPTGATTISIRGTLKSLTGGSVGLVRTFRVAAKRP